MATTYLLFAGDAYYAGGGAHDFVGEYGDPTSALLAAPQRDWVHVAELDGGKLVIVAEVSEGEVSLYPERMAHQRAAGQPSREASDGTARDA